MKIDKRSLGFAFGVLALGNLGCFFRFPGCDPPHCYDREEGEEVEPAPVIMEQTYDVPVTYDDDRMNREIELRLQEAETRHPAANATDKLRFLYLPNPDPRYTDQPVHLINPVTRELIIEAFQDAAGEQLDPELCAALCSLRNYHADIDAFAEPPTCIPPLGDALDVSLSCEAKTYDPYVHYDDSCVHYE